MSKPTTKAGKRKMQYMGGKTRIAKDIVREINKVRAGGLAWDAFCGGLSVTRQLLIGGPVVASDANVALITLYLAVQSGWVPPNFVSEDEYRAAKLLPDTDPLKAFCGFGCSFGGKWFGGYGRAKIHPNGLAGYAARRLPRDVCGVDIRQMCFLSDTPDFTPSVIYCDPPYAGVTGYSTGVFGHAVFWDKVEMYSKSCPVFVSEYTAPIGRVVFERESKTKVNAGLSGKAIVATEKLFLVGG